MNSCDLFDILAIRMKKPKQKAVQTEDSIEALNRIPDAFIKAFADEGKKAISDAWKKQLIPHSKNEQEQNPEHQSTKSGELKPGEEVDLTERKLQAIEPAINYIQEILHAERNVRVKGDQETKVKIQEIMIQIKELTKSSKELAVQFKDIEKTEYVPQNAGKYHSNFVEWVLSMVRSARERVDNALSWTNALKSKKSQRTYWNLFKKHGTSFGLSGERVMATQTG